MNKKQRNCCESFVKSVFLFSITGNKDPIFIHFNNKLQEIKNNNINKCRICIYLNPGITLRINSRQQDGNNRCSLKKCKWSTVEDDLLINSYGFTNCNITQLLMIFNNRSLGSIRTRISHLRGIGKLI